MTYQEYDIDDKYINTVIDINILKKYEHCNIDLKNLVTRYMDHEINLLGSGWVKMDYAAEVKGLEGINFSELHQVKYNKKDEKIFVDRFINYSNRKKSKQILALIDNKAYRMIDWQKDYRSGYRWASNHFSTKMKIGHIYGVDIKLPWELSRMQHLSQMSIYIMTNAENIKNIKIVAEIRHQILDFIAMNPPQYGVNWVCPMDIAIRACNWLVAIDILKVAGYSLDKAFISTVHDSLYDHAKHIINHLEWNESGRSNHYLSNIIGLLFIACYLPRTTLTNHWIAFSVCELDKEICNQFYADGSNYEGSTCYHRLSSELVLYGVALTLNIKNEWQQIIVNYNPYILSDVRPDIPDIAQLSIMGDRKNLLCDEAVNKICNLSKLTKGLTKNDNLIVQIGDNDSGRLFKFSPQYKDNVEETLDHAYLINMVNNIQQTSTIGQSFESFDSIMLCAFKNKEQIKPSKSYSAIAKFSNEALNIQGAKKYFLKNVSQNNYQQEVITRTNKSPIDYELFLDFGVVIYRGENLFLSMRASSHDNINAPKGHTHDDNLSVVVQEGSRILYNDYGSYVYTALPEKRKLYRCQTAHFVPRIKGLQAVLWDERYLFQTEHVAIASFYYVNKDGAIAVLSWSEKQKVIRIIDFSSDPSAILIEDIAIGGELEVIKPNLPYSPAYGVLES